MAQVRIMARKNGPFRVEAPEGSIELVDADGHKYDLTGKPNFALCRCGGSVNKPFCDGTDRPIGFQAAEAPLPPEEQKKSHKAERAKQKTSTRPRLTPAHDQFLSASPRQH